MSIPVSKRAEYEGGKKGGNMSIPVSKRAEYEGGEEGQKAGT